MEVVASPHIGQRVRAHYCSGGAAAVHALCIRDRRAASFCGCAVHGNLSRMRNGAGRRRYGNLLLPARTDYSNGAYSAGRAGLHDDGDADRACPA
ncbi:hypothetical protein D3C78_1284990 [compost metagenome]